MANSCMSIAALEDWKQERVRNLETELDTALIAVEKKCHWSDLDDERLRKLKAAEEELGVILLAYESERK